MRASRNRYGRAAVNIKAQLTIGVAFRHWCRAMDNVRGSHNLIALRVRRREEAVTAINARMLLPLAGMLRAWSAAAASSKSEAILQRELNAASYTSTAALGSLRAEIRWVRKQRHAQALKAIAAKLRTRLAVSFLAWDAETRSQRARQNLQRALEDADMHHVRAIAVHRANARSARAATQKVGLAAVGLRITSCLKTAFSVWRAAALLTRSSQREAVAAYWTSVICQERLHTYLLGLLGSWRQAAMRSRHNAVLCKQMS